MSGESDARALCASLCGPGCTFDHGDALYIHCMPCKLGSVQCGNRHCIKFTEDRRTQSQIENARIQETKRSEAIVRASAKRYADENEVRKRKIATMTTIERKKLTKWMIDPDEGDEEKIALARSLAKRRELGRE